MYRWLENSLDNGISEADFWNMTIAELQRAFESKKRVEKLRATEKASFDYILADLIGKSIGRLLSSANSMPDISEVYPTLFDSKEIAEKKQENKDKLSALRFIQFAQSFNNKFKSKVEAKNE